MTRQPRGPAQVDGEEVTMLHLSRLGARDGLGVIAGVTKGKALPDNIGEQILARTGGVPLFIDKVTNTLLESGLLHERPDRYILDGPLPPFAIGSIIGREFSHELI